MPGGAGLEHYIYIIDRASDPRRVRASLSLLSITFTIRQLRTTPDNSGQLRLKEAKDPLCIYYAFIFHVIIYFMYIYVLYASFKRSCPELVVHSVVVVVHLKKHWHDHVCKLVLSAMCRSLRVPRNSCSDSQCAEG